MSNAVKICRFCLGTHLVSHSIFEDDDLLIKIRTSIPVNISERDQLPKLLCEICYKKVNMVHDYFQTIKNNEEECKELYCTKDRNSQCIVEEIDDCIIKIESVDDPFQSSQESIQLSPSDDIDIECHEIIKNELIEEVCDAPLDKMKIDINSTNNCVAIVQFAKHDSSDSSKNGEENHTDNPVLEVEYDEDGFKKYNYDLLNVVSEKTQIFNENSNLNSCTNKASKSSKKKKVSKKKRPNGNGQGVKKKKESKIVKDSPIEKIENNKLSENNNVVNINQGSTSVGTGNVDNLIKSISEMDQYNKEQINGIAPNNLKNRTDDKWQVVEKSDDKQLFKIVILRNKSLPSGINSSSEIEEQRNGDELRNSSGNDLFITTKNYLINEKFRNNNQNTIANVEKVDQRSEKNGENSQFAEMSSETFETATLDKNINQTEDPMKDNDTNVIEELNRGDVLNKNSASNSITQCKNYSPTTNTMVRQECTIKNTPVKNVAEIPSKQVFKTYDRNLNQIKDPKKNNDTNVIGELKRGDALNEYAATNTINQSKNYSTITNAMFMHNYANKNVQAYGESTRKSVDECRNANMTNEEISKTATFNTNITPKIKCIEIDKLKKVNTLNESGTSSLINNPKTSWATNQNTIRNVAEVPSKEIIKTLDRYVDQIKHSKDNNTIGIVQTYGEDNRKSVDKYQNPNMTNEEISKTASFNTNTTPKIQCIEIDKLKRVNTLNESVTSSLNNKPKTAWAKNQNTIRNVAEIPSKEIINTLDRYVDQIKHSKRDNNTIEIVQTYGEDTRKSVDKHQNPNMTNEEISKTASFNTNTTPKIQCIEIDKLKRVITLNESATSSLINKPKTALAINQNTITNVAEIPSKETIKTLDRYVDQIKHSKRDNNTIVNIQAYGEGTRKSFDKYQNPNMTNEEISKTASFNSNITPKIQCIEIDKLKRVNILNESATSSLINKPTTALAMNQNTITNAANVPSKEIKTLDRCVDKIKHSKRENNTIVNVQAYGEGTRKNVDKYQNPNMTNEEISKTASFNSNITPKIQCIEIDKLKRVNTLNESATSSLNNKPKTALAKTQNTILNFAKVQAYGEGIRKSVDKCQFAKNICEEISKMTTVNTNITPQINAASNLISQSKNRSPITNTKINHKYTIEIIDLVSEENKMDEVTSHTPEKSKIALLHKILTSGVKDPKNNNSYDNDKLKKGGNAPNALNTNQISIGNAQVDGEGFKMNKECQAPFKPCEEILKIATLGRSIIDKHYIKKKNSTLQKNDSMNLTPNNIYKDTIENVKEIEAATKKNEDKYAVTETTLRSANTFEIRDHETCNIAIEEPETADEIFTSKLVAESKNRPIKRQMEHPNKYTNMNKKLRKEIMEIIHSDNEDQEGIENGGDKRIKNVNINIKITPHIWKCILCFEENTSKSDLLHHYEEHYKARETDVEKTLCLQLKTVPPAFQCRECLKILASQLPRTHLMSEHKNWMELTCGICPERFLHANNMLNHGLVAHAIDKCKKDDSSHKSIERASSRFSIMGVDRRSTSVKEIRDDTTPNRLKSSREGSEISREIDAKRLERSLRSQDRSRNSHNSDNEISLIDETTYNCDICDIAFSIEKLLERHIVSRHISEKTKRTQCPLCNAKIYIIMYKEHLKTHNNFNWK